MYSAYTLKLRMYKDLLQSHPPEALPRRCPSTFHENIVSPVSPPTVLRGCRCQLVSNQCSTLFSLPLFFPVPFVFRLASFSVYHHGPTTVDVALISTATNNKALVFRDHLPRLKGGNGRPTVDIAQKHDYPSIHNF